MKRIILMILMILFGFAQSNAQLVKTRKFGSGIEKDSLTYHVFYNSIKSLADIWALQHIYLDTNATMGFYTLGSNMYIENNKSGGSIDFWAGDKNGGFHFNSTIGGTGTPILNLDTNGLDLRKGTYKLNGQLMPSTLYGYLHKDSLNQNLSFTATVTIEAIKIPTWNNTTSTIDWERSNLQIDTVTGNTSYTFSNTADGLELQLILINTGSYTVAFTADGGTTILWIGGSQPALTASSTDIYHFIRSGAVIYGWATQDFH